MGERVRVRCDYQELNLNLQEEDPWYLLGYHKGSEEPINTTKISWWCPGYILGVLWVSPHSMVWVKSWTGESDKLALSLSDCVTWGKSLNISDPQFSHLYKERSCLLGRVVVIQSINNVFWSYFPNCQIIHSFTNHLLLFPAMGKEYKDDSSYFMIKWGDTLW